MFCLGGLRVMGAGCVGAERRACPCDRPLCAIPAAPGGISSILTAADALHAGEEIGVQLLPVIEDTAPQTGEGDI